MNRMSVTVCCCLAVAVAGTVSRGAEGVIEQGSRQEQAQVVEGQLMDMYSASQAMGAGVKREKVVVEKKLPYFDARDESASLAGRRSSPVIGEEEYSSAAPRAEARYFDARDESASLAGASSSPRLGEDMHGQGVARATVVFDDSYSSSPSLTGRTSSPVLGDDRIAAANGGSMMTYEIPAAATLKIDAEVSRERLASGVPAVVYAKGRLYTLRCDPKQVAGYAGQTVRVTGRREGNMGMLAVGKLEVRRGEGYEDVALTPTTMPTTGPSGTAIEK